MTVRTLALTLVVFFIRPLAVLACPPLPTTIDAAIRVAGLDAAGAPDVRRARAANLLPNNTRLDLHATDDDVFRLESRLDQDFDDTLSVDGSDVTDVQRSGTDQKAEIRLTLTWDLSELVWDNDELAIDRARRDRHLQRTRLANEVIDLYFDWRDNDDPRDAEQSGARLAFLTGGWFSADARCERPENADTEAGASAP